MHRLSIKLRHMNNYFLKKEEIYRSQKVVLANN